MILTLIKMAVKAAMHEAGEEWAREFGFPETVIQEMRTKRQTLALQTEVRVDALAAHALDVEEEDDSLPEEEVVEPRPVLTMASAAQVTQTDSCPAPAEDETPFLNWIETQRKKEVAWADITRTATQAGHSATEEALRSRFRRWREKNGSNSSNLNPST